jgi:alanine racemase
MTSLLSARPAWVEINLDHLASNLAAIKKAIGSTTAIMVVVKADGYGHGAVAIATAALKAGASSLAVAFVEEAVELRRAGIEAPVLILGYTDPAQFPTLIQYRLIPTIFNVQTASQFSKRAVEEGLKLPIHLKVDTGMGRIGFLPEEFFDAAYRIKLMPGLKIEGLFTHFASADEEDQTYTKEQLLLFNRIIDHCTEKGLSFPLIHAANSAASIAYPGSRYNLIRYGIALYGCYPADSVIKYQLPLRPILAFKSRVVMVKEVPPGTAISYGCSYRTTKDTIIATVPVGYADGYSRLLSNRSSILIRGQRAKVVGRVCMDHLMADASLIPGVRPGDEVVLYGCQGGEEIKVEEVAGLIGTVNYELLCIINKRVPRFYFKDGKLIAIQDLIEKHDLQKFDQC